MCSSCNCHLVVGGVCALQGSISVLGTSASLQRRCVTDTATVPLEQMKTSVPAEVNRLGLSRFQQISFLFFLPSRVCV